MSEIFSKAPEWQRERALILHENFIHVDEARGNLIQSLQSLSDALCGVFLDNYRPLKVSLGTLRREYSKWKSSGKCVEALLPDYKPGRAKIPSALVAELHRRATNPGIKNFSVAVKSLYIDWERGAEIPGLGCWFDWWKNTYPGQPFPAKAPDFPFSNSCLYNYRPAKALGAAGGKGSKTAREALPFVEMDYSKLRKCELFTLDDVRIDMMAIDPVSGVVDVVAYIMMELSSRRICGFVLRPAKAIRQSDVDALVAHVLRTEGIGNGYTTHIVFERGSVACSEAAQQALEGLSDGGIKVHRTGMNSGIRWVGEAADSGCGNPYGKGAIESFNRTLHLMLNLLPGQRGNTYQNQPQNLEAKIRESQQLAAIEKTTGENLHKPLLSILELSACVAATLRHYNNETGHEFSGHGQVFEQEVQPGVWAPREMLTDATIEEALCHV